jgi:hypothetical protein
LFLIIIKLAQYMAEWMVFFPKDFGDGWQYQKHGADASIGSGVPQI